MKKMIWFDMDGTIADLYAVDNWLPKLRSYDPSPYAEAQVMLNMNKLARLLNRVQACGYGIGIISWLSKNSTPEYDKAVTTAKMRWLKVHLKSVNFNDINIVKYGTKKADFMKTPYDILFDDEEKNRESWDGDAYTPDEILTILDEIIHPDFDFPWMNDIYE